MKKKQFLKSIFVLTLIFLNLIACERNTFIEEQLIVIDENTPTVEVNTEISTQEDYTEYKEAPTLAEMVGRGELPAVNERLPINPMVIKPLEEVGKYGGTLHRALTGPADRNGWRTIVGEALFEWEMGGTKPILSLASNYKVSDDSTIHTITLREGLKWSDGNPFTSADILFYYNAVLLNDELSSVSASQNWIEVSGVPTKIIVVDELTVEFHFGSPYVLLDDLLAYRGDEMIMPAHYMGQFHPDFTDEASLQVAVDEAGLDNWTQLFIQKNSIFLNPDLPVMNAWKVETPFPANQMVAVRNPYYWKVDTSGNQLPYIDSIVSNLLEDAEAITLLASGGGIDFQSRHIRFTDFALLSENAEINKYKVLRWADTTGWLALYMNQTHSDPVMRELMQNLDFRVGLSVAINRNEMNEILFLGIGEISHPVGMKGDPYFVDGFGQRYLEYDIGEANARLDAAGLNERDSEGYRLRPDGKRLILTITTYPFESGASSVDAYELVASYWETVGVRTIIDVKERSLWTEYVLANEHDIVGYLSAGILWSLDAQWYIPLNRGTYFAPLYGIHYSSGGDAGEQPTELFTHMQDLYDKLTTTINTETNLAIGQEILQIHDENIFIIGTIKTPFRPVIVNTELVNVVQNGIADFNLRDEGQSKFYQLFFLNP